ncbi:MAG: carbonic anhydrase [Desulfonatronovibrionaceae bacterium]
MRFCTAINCMDGRVQLPVIEYLGRRFRADYVDMITEPGPCLILAGQSPAGTLDSILARVNISVDRHASVGLAVAGHFDCAGNPETEKVQTEQIRQAVRFLRTRYSHLQIIGLWVGQGWQAEEIVVS